jgi:hypothetical protein
VSSREAKARWMSSMVASIGVNGMGSPLRAYIVLETSSRSAS